MNTEKDKNKKLSDFAIVNKNLPAFANATTSGYDGYKKDGLTKREYFAALAMHAFAANPEWIKTMKVPDDWDEYTNRLAEGALDLADAVLSKL